MNQLFIVVIIYFLYSLLKIYVSVKEKNFVDKSRNDEPIILSPINYKKAAAYKIWSERIEIANSFIDLVMFIFWISFGLKWLDNIIIIDNILIKSVIFINIFIIINYIATLPIDLFKIFVIDKRFAFSNMTPKLYILDTIKSMIILFIFGSLIIYSISYIIETFNSWWLYGFIFIFAVIILINLIYPTLIAPIFNKFTPLKNEELKSSIEMLLKKVGLNSSGVFTIDASKRDNRLNAYFGGLGKSKRVVLFDTLIKKLSNSELLAVLGHELGHFKNKDILKNIFMMGFLLFVMFVIFGNLPNELFQDIGVKKSPHMVIILFLLLSSIFSFFMMPLFGMVSRSNEYKADEFGAECESKTDLANALRKLADENKSFPKSHPLYIFFYFTHPPLTERLKRLEE